MKYVLMVLVVLFVTVGCTKICDEATKYTTQFSVALSDRWSCDSAKVTEFLTKPVSALFCKEKSVASEVCPVVVDLIVKLGAEGIANKFSCDVAKVKADLDNAGQLCKAIKVE